MALGDRRRAEAIRATRKEAGMQEAFKRTVVTYPSQGQSRKHRPKKERFNFSLRIEEREALAQLTNLLGEKSDSEVLGKLIMQAYKGIGEAEEMK
ncbi:hypothetical protein [Lactococcus taiwanensis]|uniref:hypothetical protein n=1 Tax=Lactococcus taiwanensis TaxID=1151742 RepID=UPI003515DBD2